VYRDSFTELYFENHIGGIFMNLRPLSDRVILKRIAAEETTKSGIFLPAPRRKSRRCMK
jgi:hypothetical protein